MFSMKHDDFLAIMGSKANKKMPYKSTIGDWFLDN